MTTFATPRTRLHDDQQLVDIPTDETEGLWLECEITHPQSRQGQRIVLRVLPEQLVPLHTLVKAAMRQQRATPEGASRR